MRLSMARLWVCLAIAGGWDVAALAAGPPGAGNGPLQVDTGASRVYIKVTSATRLGHDHGVVGRLATGSVALGGSGELVFDMRSFESDRVEARRYVGLTTAVSPSDAAKSTAAMLGKDVLSVARFPTSRYVFRAARPLDGQPGGAPGRYQLDGEFTLHGVTRSIPLIAVAERTDLPGILRLRCEFSILQSDYGMKPYSALGGLVGVNDELRIWGELAIRPTVAASVPPTRAAR